MTKILTEQQSKFLEALFGEAQGNAAQAKKLAGYAESTKTIDILRGLKDEILEAANLTLVQHSPRAVLELVGLVVDPNQSGAPNKLKAIQEVLNRSGVNAPKENQGDVNLKVPQGGLFIMPAKESASSLDLKESHNDSKEETKE